MVQKLEKGPRLIGKIHHAFQKTEWTKRGLKVTDTGEFILDTLITFLRSTHFKKDHTGIDTTVIVQTVDIATIPLYDICHSM